MYDDDNWTGLTGEELAKILEQVNPVDGKYAVSVETTEAGWRTLPFYNQAKLIRLTESPLVF